MHLIFQQNSERQRNDKREHQYNQFYGNRTKTIDIAFEYLR